MAFSGKGAMSGAAGGAMLGAKTGNPYVAAGGAVVGGLMGAFGGEEGTAPVRHQDWLQNPQYDWTEGLLKDQAGFYGDELSRIRRGEAPAYWDSLEGSIRNQQQGDLDLRYFGREGERGGSIMDIMQSAGAQGGIGMRGTNANVTKGLRDFSRERQTIENYITQLRAGEMQNAYNTIPGGINALSQGPEGEWDNWTEMGTAGTDPGGDLLGMGMQFGSFGLGGGGGPTSVTGMDGGSIPWGGGGQFQSQDILGRSIGSQGFGNYTGGSQGSNISILQGGGNSSAVNDVLSRYRGR